MVRNVTTVETVDGTTYQTTTTTVEYAITPGQFWFDPSYIRTLGGLLKCIQLALDFICFICILAGPQWGYGGAAWGIFVSIMAFVITLFLLMLYILHVIEATGMIPWSLVEMVYCFVWSVFFFIAGCVLAVASSHYARSAPWAVAAFFAFCAMLAYALDCFLKFRDWRSGSPAQGGVPMVPAVITSS